jgi:acetoin utilization deacetylase AcuC-like enzyme
MPPTSRQAGEVSLEWLAPSDAGLAERDRRVTGFFREQGISVACVMAGGYGADIAVIARWRTIVRSVATEYIG